MTPPPPHSHKDFKNTEISQNLPSPFFKKLKKARPGKASYAVVGTPNGIEELRQGVLLYPPTCTLPHVYTGSVQPVFPSPPSPGGLRTQDPLHSG